MYVEAEPVGPVPGLAVVRRPGSGAGSGLFVWLIMRVVGVRIPFSADAWRSTINSSHASRPLAPSTACPPALPPAHRLRPLKKATKGARAGSAQAPLLLHSSPGVRPQ